ncbi:hypothetical protein [Mastigocoleus testarum]|uniref:Uncharacterized protein n=1 Tax=Mastigocoleus testarum BC008 TaxID=371196 RepID=A0A0V7ZBR3_9CYAN|nr:hypothetical protein [Mastigocoleus testarum]KST61962.1 hypothetical protein BC008_07970 [Mastigocoleus testarum BC008]
MKLKISSHYQPKENVVKIAEEYCTLIRLSSPSDIELERIEEIMELAVDNAVLNNLLNQVDQKYAFENNLLRDDDLDDSHQVSLELNRDKDRFNIKNSTKKSDIGSNVVLFPRLFTSHLKKKRKFLKCDIRLVISSFAAVGIVTLIGTTKLYHFVSHEKTINNVQQQTIPPALSVSHVSNTEKECNSNGIPNQKIKNYYAAFNQLENRIETKQLPPLKAKSEARELQRLAEKQQRKAEQNQRHAEAQKKQAEKQHHYDEAQNWKDEAQTSLLESKQWLCLSQQALNLSAY